MLEPNTATRSLSISGRVLSQAYAALAPSSQLEAVQVMPRSRVSPCPGPSMERIARPRSSSGSPMSGLSSFTPSMPGW